AGAKYSSGARDSAPITAEEKARQSGPFPSLGKQMRSQRALEETGAAAVRHAVGDQPAAGVVRACPCRAGTARCGPGFAVVGREPELPALCIAVVDLAIDLRHDLDRDLGSGLEIQLLGRCDGILVHVIVD